MKESKIGNRNVRVSDAESGRQFGERQLVGFRVGTQEFGVDIKQIREIIREVKLATLPDSPDFIEGVVNLRGSVMPVVDLRKKFGIPRNEHGSDTRIIITELQGGPIGFIVDNVTEVRRVIEETIESVPAGASNGSSRYVHGIAKLDDGLLIILDLEKILSSDEVESIVSAEVTPSA